ncbi:MAG: ATP-binding cassette domain-containing protein [Candidatus Hodarchaeales archaeon]|jgi:ABC-type multidrug transport system ATPase subunit
MVTDVIRTDNLSKTFLKEDVEVKAVEDLSISVKEGSITAVLGPNGAGKTTAMRILAGILKPTSGTCWINGINVIASPNDTRNQIGFLPEDHNLYNRLTAFENIKFFAQLYGNYDKKQIRELLDIVELRDWIDRKVGTFSKGMTQKVALACSLAHYPAIALLDEPTSALDPDMQKVVRRMIQRLAKDLKMTFFIATHNLPEAEKLADQIIIINHGRLQIQGSPEEIRKEIGETIFRVEFVNDAAKFKPIFRKHADVEIWQVTGNYIDYKIHSRQYDDVNPGLIVELVNQGARIARVEDSSPTLDQLYSKIIRRSEQ